MVQLKLFFGANGFTDQMDATSLPNFITHYHPAEDPPFRNLSEVPQSQRSAVLKALAQRSSKDSGFKRVFGPRYIDFRIETERKMLALFKESGGKPERAAPHYFVLGESRWFERLYPRTSKVVLPIEQLPNDVTSITYPDSMTAMQLGHEFGLPLVSEKPYHGQVFRLDELPHTIAEFGLPEDEHNLDYENYHRKPFEKYVEVQLWSNKPIRDFL